MSSPIAFNSGELITDAITSAFFSKATLVAFKMFFTVTLEPAPTDTEPKALSSEPRLLAVTEPDLSLPIKISPVPFSVVLTLPIEPLPFSARFASLSMVMLPVVPSAVDTNEPLLASGLFKTRLPEPRSKSVCPSFREALPHERSDEVKSDNFLSEVSTSVMVLSSTAVVPPALIASSKLALPESGFEGSSLGLSLAIFKSRIPVSELNKTLCKRFASSKLTSLLKSTKLTFDKASASKVFSATPSAVVVVSSDNRVLVLEFIEAPFSSSIEPASSVFRTPLLVKSNTESSPESNN